MEEGGEKKTPTPSLVPLCFSHSHAPDLVFPGQPLQSCSQWEPGQGCPGRGVTFCHLLWKVFSEG